MQNYLQGKSIVSFSIVLFVIIMVLPSTTSSQEPLRPLPTSLIFVSTRFSPIQILSVNPETLEMYTLATLKTDDLLPLDVAWSPIGNRFAIAFTHSLGEITEDTDRVCVYMQDGSEQGCINTSIADGSAISWSGDGEKVLILTENEEGIQVAEITYAPERITYKNTIPLPFGERLDTIYWSPSGKKLLYQTVELRGNAIQGYNLYALSLDHREAIFLAHQRYGIPAAWSPDEERIIAPIGSKLTVFTTTGDIVTEIELTYREKQLLLELTAIAWSNDGTRIAFSDVYEEQTVGIFVLILDSGEIYQLMDNFFPVNKIAWSPDDNYLAMDPCCNGFAEVVIVSLDGWEKWYRILDDSIAFPAWQPIDQ
jgi:dipeptidyl aminopeptidase/acylaminoacyl peptidase